MVVPEPCKADGGAKLPRQRPLLTSQGAGAHKPLFRALRFVISAPGQQLALYAEQFGRTPQRLRLVRIAQRCVDLDETFLYTAGRHHNCGQFALEVSVEQQISDLARSLQTQSKQPLRL